MVRGLGLVRNTRTATTSLAEQYAELHLCDYILDRSTMDIAQVPRIAIEIASRTCYVCKLFLSIVDKCIGLRASDCIELTIIRGYPYDRFFVSREEEGVIHEYPPFYIFTPSGTAYIHDSDLAFAHANCMKSDFAKISTFPFRAVCDMNVLPHDTASEASISWARSQISECCKNHSCLPMLRSTQFPSRVLDVSGLLGDRVNLVITARKFSARYICLSHCWGDQNSIVRTMTNNLEEHIKGIQISSLPVTFRDAIDISRRLGIRYLWIDSLCIVQDSEQDWLTESAEMANIYENAYITISATASSNGHGGCYQTTPLAESDQEIELEDKSTGLYVRQPPTHFDLYIDLALNKYGSGFPLLKRAWVWQERLLSPRTLHFCNREIVFECRRTKQCQCGESEIQANIKGDFIRMLDSDPSLSYHHARVGWWTVVQRYTRLGLTFDKDRLSALAGVAGRMKNQQTNDYLAGIWRSSFPYGLLWRVDYESLETDGIDVKISFPHRLPDPRAPSWSWASLSSAVVWDFPSRFTKKMVETDTMQIHEASCFPTGDNQYGQVNGGVLRLTGFVTYSTLQWEALTTPRRIISGSSGLDLEWRFSGLPAKLDPTKRFSSYQFHQDYDFHLEEQSPIEVVLLWVTPGRLLVLKPVAQTEKFERIGIICADKFLDSLSIREIESFPEVGRSTLEIV